MRFIRRIVPSKTAEKAILTGASTGATMEIADALLAAESSNYVIKNKDGPEQIPNGYDECLEYLTSVSRFNPMTPHQARNQCNLERWRKCWRCQQTKHLKDMGGVNTISYFGKETTAGDLMALDKMPMCIECMKLKWLTPRERVRYEAESFNVEFDDWADQEMKSHGENVSFKKWAKEEGEKHGDVPLTDWAEHEEESHDERYGAEDCEHFMGGRNI